MDVINNKEMLPMKHYQKIFASLSPDDIASRCNLTFVAGSFELTLLGSRYIITHPDALATPLDGAPPLKNAEYILLLRFLCEGRWTEGAGKKLSYREVPWGEVYFRQFEGRVLKRLAFTFCSDIDGLKSRLAASSMNAEVLAQGDAAYRFDFLNGLCLTLSLYAADEDFPPSAQLLFDDALAAAFSAEDLAVVGETLIGRLKSLT
jgi:hypothetical protein